MQHLQFASFYCPCWLVQTRLDMYSVLHNSCIFMDQYGRIQRTKTHFPKKPIHVECCWIENLMVLNHVKPTITHHFLWKFTIRTVLKTTMVVAYWVILLPFSGNLNGFVILYCQIIFRRTEIFTIVFNKQHHLGLNYDNFWWYCAQLPWICSESVIWRKMSQWEIHCLGNLPEIFCNF